MREYAEYVPHHFQNLINSSVVHSLPIPQKPPKAIGVNLQTNRQRVVKKKQCQKWQR